MPSSWPRADWTTTSTAPSACPTSRRRPDMDLGLTDRVFIVTGGARGLGRATAEVLVAEGARVVLSGRTEQTLAGAVDALGDHASYVVGDNAEASLPARLVAAAHDRWARLDG